MAERTRGGGFASADPREVSPDDAVALALAEIVASSALTELTLATVTGLWRALVARAQKSGARSIAEVDGEFVLEFVRARCRNGSRPSAATMHLRRWSVRLLFQVVRRVGVGVVDPTVDLVLPSRPVTGVRPLSDEEVALCRVLAAHPSEATLKPAAWGLAETTATTAEIPAVRRADVETDTGVVRLPGSRLVLPRQADLTEWATIQIDRRLHEIESEDASLVAYEGGGTRPQAAAAMVIGKVLRRAGVGGEPGIRPASIRAWAGVRFLRETGSIEEVARRLGLRSLDSAARLIGLDWRGD